MTEAQGRKFAQTLLAEAGIIAETYDGTVGSDAFRNRVQTLGAALEIFQRLTGMLPAAYIKKLADEADDRLAEEAQYGRREQ